MAKINKQEVIQKLVDELNLYPGKDLIPTELADKILAVYQINTEDVTVSVQKKVSKKQNITPNIQDKTFTVPVGKVWEFVSAAVELTTTATVGNRYMGIRVRDETGQMLFTTVLITVPVVASRVADFVYMQGFGVPYADQDKNYSFFVSIPQDLILKEGYTIQFTADDAAATPIDVLDDMDCTLFVDEQNA